MEMMRPAPFLRSLARMVIALGVLAAGAAGARPLQSIRNGGVLHVCANPNALPFSSRKGQRRGFEVELAETLAKQLGVGLALDWVVFPFQAGRVDCDVVFDAIVDPESADDRHLRLSKPYRSSGVAIALKPGMGGVAGFGDLKPGQRVGAIVGSLASVTLGRRGQATIPFTFEDELIEALGRGELDAALVTPATVGYYNLLHKAAPLGLVHAYASEPALRWNVAVGMRKADDSLVGAVNAALGRLVGDGTVDRIYASYGIAPSPPR